MTTELRFRQVHLDYHTSPDIPGIGAEFDAEHFAAVLEKARVDRQSPSSGEADYAGVVRNGNVIYFAHPIFTQYQQNAPLVQTNVPKCA